LVPLSHKLQSGDQVEILTSKSQHVSPSWINFVYTAKAKAKIQSILRRDNREVLQEGENLLNSWLTKNGFEASDAIIDQLAMFHDMKNQEELFIALGEKSVLLGEKDIDELKGKKSESSTNWLKYVPFVKSKKKEEAAQPELFTVPEKFNRKKPIYITDDNIHQYKFPDCCHPIPGDDVLGYIDKKNQIEIHKRSCSVANMLKTSYGNRILDAKWDMHKKLFFDASIHMAGIDRRGLVNEVTRVISNQLNIDIRKLTFTTEDGIFDGVIDLRVHDCEDLKEIMDSLKSVEGLKEISRIM
jgi:GTP pyrophosphokinase